MMKRTVLSALCLLLVCGSGVAPLPSALAQGRPPTRGSGREERDDSSLLDVLEQQQFVFSRRNRRDPFSPLGGGDDGKPKDGEGRALTAQDISEAQKALTLSCTGRLDSCVCITLPDAIASSCKTAANPPRVGSLMNRMCFA